MTQIGNRTAKLLDCTFRDGGYYTNWEFPDDLVKDYLAALADLPITAIELGYAGKGPGAGRFGNLDNRKVRALRGATTALMAVMLDAKDYFADADPGVKLDQVLGQRCGGGIDAIRLAVHFRDAPRCGPLLKALSARGYRVFLNLMQIDLATPDAISACRDLAGATAGLAAVYLADSLGAMRPARVHQLVSDFAADGATEVGFHAHDNCGFAIANVVAAAAAGATWLDSTIAGMGRGAGNASTEQVLGAVAMGCAEDAEARLHNLVAQHFNPLKARHGWGDSLVYHVGARKGLHPTYVQEVVGDAALSGLQALGCIRQIPAGTASFDRAILEQARGRWLSDNLSEPEKMEQVA
jgi:4-hydroxy 2-oxovalerate aldolase